MSKSIKITKILLVEAITDHLLKQGQRMTNLNKAPIDKLEELIKKFNININEFNDKRVQEKKNEKITYDKRREEERLIQEEKKRNQEIINNKIKNLTDLITPEVKTNCINKVIMLYELRSVMDWKENAERYNKKNTDLINEVERFYNHYKERGGRVERGHTPEYLTVNGINVSYGGLITKDTTADFIKYGNSTFNNQCFQERLLTLNILEILSTLHITPQPPLKPKKKVIRKKLRIVEKL